MDGSGAYDDDGRRIDVWPVLDLEHDRRVRELAQWPVAATLGLAAALTLLASPIAGILVPGALWMAALGVWAAARPTVRLVIELGPHRLRIGWRGLPWARTVSVPLADLAAADLGDYTLTLTTRRGPRRVWFPPCTPDVEEEVREVLAEALALAAAEGSPDDVPSSLALLSPRSVRGQSARKQRS